MVWYKRSCCSAPIKSCMLCSAGANGVRSDQWQKNRGQTFFQDLDWLSCGEWWQSLHLLIWHVRSCMLCSASSNDMRSDQWQTISVCPHLLPRFRLIVFKINDQVFRSCCSAPIKSCLLCSAGVYGMRSDQWQKNRGHTFFSRFGLVVLWWTMTKSSSAYMTFKKLYALLC